MTDNRGNVDANKLTAFAAKALQTVGIPDEDARLTAQLLVAADLRGIDSHGVTHLASFYVKRIKNGMVNPQPKMTITRLAPATAVLDGDRGLGFVVGYRAMVEAMSKAETEGAGFVTVRNSTHFGAACVYAMLALSRDMIGVAMTTGGVRMQVPGAKGYGAAINVLSIAAPSGAENPFVLDMATTAVAGGQVDTAKKKGIIMPVGWAVDRDGNPLTDPNEFGEKGALLPLGGAPDTGGYKGFGLSVAVEILCSILSGTISRTEELVRAQNESATRGRANHFFGALRIGSFIPPSDFKKSMDNMITAFQGLPKAPGVDRIGVAGHRAQETERKRRKEGIPLHPTVVKALEELASELHIECDLWPA